MKKGISTHSNHWLGLMGMTSKKVTLKIEWIYPYIQVGVSSDNKVRGICFLDKYCWTNVFGFEILK